MSVASRTGGVVLTLHAGLLVNARIVVASSSEVVTEVTSSLTEHVGPTPERSHGRSLTLLA